MRNNIFFWFQMEFRIHLRFFVVSLNLSGDFRSDTVHELLQKAIKEENKTNKRIRKQ
jgi:hypothetical protein